MESIRSFELPKDLYTKLQKAKKLEWITIVYLVSVTVIMYLTMGTSQAMKSAWLEDVLSLIPAIVFLISSHINNKTANHKFPYGYHRVFSIAFLVGSVALLGMGIFLVYDSSMALIKADHPTIGNKIFFGYQIWMGWIMILALLYSAVPAMILGYKKVPLAKKLHNKVLLTDAKAQKSDYLTAFAAIIGILGVGAGVWWTDAVAAIIISGAVLKDGVKQTKSAVLDLMDRYPQVVTGEKEDPLVNEINEIVLSWDWVKEGAVRFREHGQVYLGEIMVVPKREISLDELTRGYQTLKEYHWKIHDFTIAPVKKLPKW